MAKCEDLRFHRNLLSRIGDPVLLVAAMLGIGWFRWGSLPPRIYDWWPVLFILPTAPIIFEITGVYRAFRHPRLQDWFGAVISALLVLYGVLLIIGYITKTSDHFSRTVILGWMILSPVVLCLLRAVLYWDHSRRLKDGSALEPVVLVGASGDCRAFAEHLAANPWLGLCPKVLAVEADAVGPPIPLDGCGHPVTVRPRGDLRRIVQESEVGRVVICGPPGNDHLMMEVLAVLRDIPVVVQYAPDFSSMPIFSLRISDVAGRPLLHLSDSPLSEQAETIKWVEDKVLVLLALAIFGLPMLVIALLVRLTSPGPALFAQERHGKGGRIFRMLKFRTMHAATGEKETAMTEAPAPTTVRTTDRERTSRRYRTGEDGRLIAVDLRKVPEVPPPAAAPVAEPRRHTGDGSPDDFTPARPDDPRITRLGRILRRTSLDELPQLINVLRGDMSLVGPRPHAIRHNEQYASSILDLMRRHYIKPGITGLAQISGSRGSAADTATMRRRVEFDLEYMRNWSLWLDLKILGLTVVMGFLNRQP
jgi:putative colanic acid biosynthesis UDP-glucose lipid carrier transferase